MKKIAFAFLLGSIAFGSCNKIVEVEDLDKQITIHFVNERVNSNLPYFETSSTRSVLKDFDKRDYKHLDSITFNIGLMTESLSDIAYVRLYNMTDKEEIANSRVKGSTNGFIGGYVEFNSDNILHSLPDKRISIAVQIMSGTEGKTALGITPFLKLRRN